MTPVQKSKIEAILRDGKDITLATLRPDGAPQATTVSYASDGLLVYFGCDAASPKARNLMRDPRISGTVNLPYRDWSEILGVSLFGRAARVTDLDEIGRVGVIFLGKFPEVAQYVQPGAAPPAFFRITPEIVSVLDYKQGFGRTELVEIAPAELKSAA